MSDDYRVKARSDQEVRQFAKKSRVYFGVADCKRLDVLDCLKREYIWTVRGQRRLNFQVRPDNEMGDADGSTTYGKGIVSIAVKESVRDAALVGDGRSRNTLAHELGHAVLHDGPPLFRRLGGTMTPKYLRSYESAEHQAKVFAPAFLINDAIACTLDSAEAISVELGISLESAKIYFDSLAEQRDRARHAERVLRSARQLAADFRASTGPGFLEMKYLSARCVICSHRTVFPIGIKFMCHNCKTVFDRFQDGDPGDFGDAL
jgi:hypothetical protein